MTGDNNFGLLVCCWRSFHCSNEFDSTVCLGVDTSELDSRTMPTSRSAAASLKSDKGELTSHAVDTYD